ncbi:MAG: tetratricopeptide repeat protein [Candidatus Hydrogenedentes bacterium]|nr:tetratricopeptide repeat protein [Candidatus Hydrogenedentota bacterium]
MGILRAIRRNRIHRKVLRATGEQAISILRDYLQKDPHWQESRVLLAWFYAQRLDFDAVTKVIKEHAQLFPEDTRALFILASTLRLLGHHEQAITLLESLQKLAPDFPGLQTEFAAALMETEPSRALQLIDKVLSHEPNDAEGHHYRGRILANLERWPEAKKEFSIASELEPAQTTYLIVLALHCCEFGDYEDARTHLQHALTLDSNNAFICVNWARFQADYGNKDEAITLCCEGLEKFMGDRVAARDFAGILVNICVSDEEPNPAALTRGPASDEVPSILDQRILPLLRTYVDRDPEWLDGRIDVARVQEHYGRREEAASQLKSYLDGSSNDAKVLYALGGVHERMRDFSSARQYLEELVRRFPEHPNAHRELGALLLHFDSACALAELDVSVSQAPDDAMSHWLRGHALLFLSRDGEARQAFLTAASLAPDEAIYRLGLVEASKLVGNDEETKEYYRQALRLDPGSPSILAEWGEFVGECGGREEAAELLGAALVRFPENGDLRRVYADCLLDLGRTDEALDIIMPATKSGTEDAGALCVLAKCYARVHDSEQLQRVCERVKALDSEAYEALCEELD